MTIEKIFINISQNNTRNKIEKKLMNDTLDDYKQISNELIEIFYIMTQQELVKEHC